MNKLAKKSLKTLEYASVLEKLSTFAVSDGAKDYSMKLLPTFDTEEFSKKLKQTSDAKDIMVRHSSPPFARLTNPEMSLKRTKIGGSLNMKELLEIARLLKVARQVKTFDTGENVNSLTPLFSRISTNKYLEDKIENAILSDTEISDNASSELYSIRRKIKNLNLKVREILNKYISSSSSKYLQENLITMRSNRFVIPVKSEHKGEVSGLVHDVSSSGATLFIEPTAVV